MTTETKPSLVRQFQKVLKRVQFQAVDGINVLVLKLQNGFKSLRNVVTNLFGREFV